MREPNFSRIARHYAVAGPKLQVTPANRWALDPYAWDHQAGIEMSPIEAAIWHDIRNEGLVLYPQFPVAGYFVDFGNPAARVAIECDGKAFHQDAAADRKRQRHIEAKGWAVYRLTGAQCAAVDDRTVDGFDRESYTRNPAAQLLAEVGRRHGIML